MRDQLQALEELQRFDLALRELEDQLTEIPSKLSELRTDVDRVRQLLDSERAQLADVERMRKEGERDIDLQSEMIAKSKAKSSASRNQKEFEAAQREIEAVRRSVQERETETVKLMEAIEVFKASIVSHETEFKTLQDHLDREEAEARAKLMDLEEKRKEKMVARQTISDRIGKQILRRYEMIRERRGVALAEVRGGTCSGCNVQLPPQLFNVLQTFATIEICPTCNRIIYFRTREETAQP